MNAYARNKTTLRQKKQQLMRFMVSATFRMGLMVFIVAFGFLYIWQTNSVSTKGYVISDLEAEVKKLEQETRRLEVHIAEHSSMQRLQERIAATDLVSAGTIDYINAVGSAVAQR